MFERHVETFERLGFSVDLSNPVFPKKVNLSKEIIDILNFNEHKLIGIAPFAQYHSKVYPLDLMQRVIDELAKDKSSRITLFGGGIEEIQKLNQLKGNYQNVTVIAGKINLKQELELISNLDVMISMDSGNAHLAAMFGVKVISLWGATHPYAGFYPFKQDPQNALLADREQFPLIPTSVYGNKYPSGYENAMRTIAPEDVILKIEEIINK